MENIDPQSYWCNGVQQQPGKDPNELLVQFTCLECKSTFAVLVHKGQTVEGQLLATRAKYPKTETA